MKRNMKRKGFTLVELLIVIVVIGILSAMMMLSSTEAVSSAQASNIVSNLRNLKTAALSWYVDNLDDISDGTVDSFKAAEILGYLSAPLESTSYNFFGAKPAFAEGTATELGKSSGFTYSIQYKGASLSDTGWYLSCTVSETNVKNKLASRAKAAGLLKTTNKADVNYDGSEGTVYYFVR